MIAVTRTFFDPGRCAIIEADQTYNAVGFTFSVNGSNTDLQSIAAHENGHWLGLDHTPVNTATMFASYIQGTTSLRDLDPDDDAGVCDLYPFSGPRESDCFASFFL